MHEIMQDNPHINKGHFDNGSAKSPHLSPEAVRFERIDAGALRFIMPLYGQYVREIKIRKERLEFER